MVAPPRAVRMSEPQHEKADVDYGRGLRNAHCSICQHFREPAACELVIGRIRPQDWCKLFQRKGA